MNGTAHYEPAELPPALRREAAVLLPLATSGFLEHYLERFLETAGRWLRVPWWFIHAGLYLLTGLLAARCVNLAKLFPGGPGMALWGVFAAEFTFTTWMLTHLRQARTLALLTAARIESGADRLTWLRRFYGPMHWGWVMRARNDPSHHRRPKRLGLLPLTVLLMAIFYVYLLWPSLESGSPGLWLIFSFHLLGCYPLAAKAAMLLAVLAHFWLLRGLVKSRARHLAQHTHGKCAPAALGRNPPLGLAAQLHRGARHGRLDVHPRRVRWPDDLALRPDGRPGSTFPDPRHHSGRPPVEICHSGTGIGPDHQPTHFRPAGTEPRLQPRRGLGRPRQPGVPGRRRLRRNVGQTARQPVK